MLSAEEKRRVLEEEAKTLEAFKVIFFSILSNLFFYIVEIF
jgi:hypothetical protein